MLTLLLSTKPAVMFPFGLDQPVVRCTKASPARAFTRSKVWRGSSVHMKHLTLQLETICSAAFSEARRMPAKSWDATVTAMPRPRPCVSRISKPGVSMAAYSSTTTPKGVFASVGSEPRTSSTRPCTRPPRPTAQALRMEERLIWPRFFSSFGSLSMEGMRVT